MGSSPAAIPVPLGNLFSGTLMSEIVTDEGLQEKHNVYTLNLLTEMKRHNIQVAVNRYQLIYKL